MSLLIRGWRGSGWGVSKQQAGSGTAHMQRGRGGRGIEMQVLAVSTARDVSSIDWFGIESPPLCCAREGRMGNHLPLAPCGRCACAPVGGTWFIASYAHA